MRGKEVLPRLRNQDSSGVVSAINPHFASIKAPQSTFSTSDSCQDSSGVKKSKPEVSLMEDHFGEMI